ncbi:MAG: hypothetical protein IJT94_18710, partial [Oscillibacter sp.]|nr:hypothetical protein [Oscillibacter sp.]
MDDHEGTTSTNGIYTTDANGEITIFKLDPGTYTVTETRAPDGYTLDRTPQTVEVRENDSQTLTFRDTALQSLTITKYEDGTTTPLAGVNFSVTDGNGAPIGRGTYTTDASGRITINGLTPGMMVVVRETRTVRGYVLDGEPQTIVIGNGGNTVVSSGTAARSGTAGGNALVFYDSPLSSLIVHCYVDGTDNEPLTNVGFNIVDGSGRSVGYNDGVYYTNNAGNITLTDLQPGVTINARMIRVPAGFVLDGQPKDIVMESGSVQELTFWAKRQGALAVRALDQRTREPIPNVEFRIAYADGRPVDDIGSQTSSGGIYTTDASGEIHITSISGAVVVTEQRTVDGYTMNPASTMQTVTVNPAETQTLSFYDIPSQALTVQLYARGTTDPIAGARFLLTDGTGARIGSEDGEFVTDE